MSRQHIRGGLGPESAGLLHAALPGERGRVNRERCSARRHSFGPAADGVRRDLKKPDDDVSVIVVKGPVEEVVDQGVTISRPLTVEEITLLANH
jgi:hypothetical protein